MHISRADEWTQFLWNVQGKQHVSTVQLTLMERGCSLAKMCLLSIKLIEFPICVLQHLLNSCHLNFAQTVLQQRPSICFKKIPKACITPQCTFQRVYIEGLTELWNWPGDRGLWYTPPVWVISLLQPTALWSVLPSQERASRICQSASPSPTPFPLNVNTTFSPHIYLCAHRLPSATRMHVPLHARTHEQKQFPLWWQILPELASICESWHGVLYESKSPVICLSQMDPLGVQRHRLVVLTAG